MAYLFYVREGLLAKVILLSILCGNDTRSCWFMMQYHFQPSVGSFVIVSISGSVAMPKWSLRLKTLALSSYKRYFKPDHNSHFPPYWTCVKLTHGLSLVFLSSLCSIKDFDLVIEILSNSQARQCWQNPVQGINRVRSIERSMGKIWFQLESVIFKPSYTF